MGAASRPALPVPAGFDKATTHIVAVAREQAGVRIRILRAFAGGGLKETRLTLQYFHVME